MEVICYNPMHETSQPIKSKHNPKNNTLYDTYEKSYYKPIKPLSQSIKIENTPLYKEIVIRIPNNNFENTRKTNLKKQALFSEIEYLEGYYDHITFSIASNKVITINVLGPKQLYEVREPLEIESYKKMPILSFCKEIKKDSKELSTLYLPERLTFVIPPEYPNHPPFLYIKNVLYTHTINCCNLTRIKEIIGKYVKTYRPHQNCISCGSILIPKNWTSTTRFSNIFDELHIIRRFKSIVKYEIILQELMKKRQLEIFIIQNILEFLSD
jgi:hypothetical protein